jgi:hypothetical protein
LHDLLVDVADDVRTGLWLCLRFTGAADVLGKAREVLPDDVEIRAALDDLEQLATSWRFAHQL